MRKTLIIALALVCLSSSAFAVEFVTNGGFGSQTGWTQWTERGTWAANFNTNVAGDCPTGGTLPCYLNTSTNLNGGVWQQLTNMVNGGTYTFTTFSRDTKVGNNSCWAEVHVGTAAPVNGSDYGNAGTQKAKWDDFACNDWNTAASAACVQAGSSFTAPAGTSYLVLKSGDGGSNVRMSFDTISVDGALPVEDWMLY